MTTGARTIPGIAAILTLLVLTAGCTPKTAADAPAGGSAPSTTAAAGAPPPVASGAPATPPTGTGSQVPPGSALPPGGPRIPQAGTH